MNEKIKLLAERASSRYDQAPGIKLILNPEKFAELIIKESCELFTDPYEAYSGAYIHLKIKQHFGVEE